MKKYIDRLKKIETLVELSIGTVMTEDKVADIYALTNELMCMSPTKKPPKAKVYTGRYIEKLDSNWVDIYTVEEWNRTVDGGWLTNDDGSGYWMKDCLKSTDEVFSTPQLDATHVVWYNK
jgi:hypothetical protein